MARCRCYGLGMEARDFRSIGRAAQEELRRRALFLIERQGLNQGQAAQLVGVHRQTVNTWVKRHREQGEGGLLGLTAVQLYLQRWGLTPQKPLIRAKERSPGSCPGAWCRNRPPLRRPS